MQKEIKQGIVFYTTQLSYKKRLSLYKQLINILNDNNLWTAKFWLKNTKSNIVLYPHKISKNIHEQQIIESCVDSFIQGLLTIYQFVL